MNKLLSIATLATALASPFAASTALANDTGFYVTAGVGSSKYADLPGADSSTGGKLVLGYQVNSLFAVEGGYLDLGSSGFRQGGFSGTVHAKGFNASLVARAPVSDVLSVHGKVGYFSGDADGSVAGTNVKASGSDPSFGLGLGYQFNKTTSALLEWDRVGSSDAIDMVSIGVKFKF